MTALATQTREMEASSYHRGKVPAGFQVRFAVTERLASNTKSLDAAKCKRGRDDSGDRGANVRCPRKAKRPCQRCSRVSVTRRCFGELRMHKSRRLQKETGKTGASVGWSSSVDWALSQAKILQARVAASSSARLLTTLERAMLSAIYPSAS